MKTIILTLTYFLLSTHLLAQENHAIIHTDFTKHLKNKNLKDSIYHIEINGIDVSQSGKSFKVPIKKNHFDTIKFSHQNKKETWAIMKLLNETHYQLENNSCSFYTLQAQIKPLQGIVKFSIKNQDSISYLVGIDDFDRIINRRKFDRFYYTIPSPMCPFAARPIEIKSLDGELVTSIKFHFLHGEKLKVIYDQKSDTMVLKLKGRVKNKSKLKHYAL